MITIKVHTHSEDDNRFATEVGTNCLTKIIIDMKQRIRACRVVLKSGYTIMDYIDKSCSRGIAFAGSINHNYPDLWNCTQEEFEKRIQDWAIKNKDNEDVEYIEFI